MNKIYMNTVIKNIKITDNNINDIINKDNNKNNKDNTNSLAENSKNSIEEIIEISEQSIENRNIKEMIITQMYVLLNSNITELIRKINETKQLSLEIQLVSKKILNLFKNIISP